MHPTCIHSTVWAEPASELGPDATRHRHLFEGRGKETGAMGQSILERIAQGEQNAVSECLDQYSDLVWSIARRMSPSRHEISI